MPVIDVSYSRLSSIIGAKPSKSEIQELLFNYGIEANANGDTLSLEITHDRPDLLSTFTIAKALKRYLLKEEPSDFRLKDSKYTIDVEKPVKEIRPFIAGFVVRNAKLTTDDVKELINIQEKLHSSFGSDRKLASIGLYNLDMIRSPITYSAWQPEKIKFVPLNKDAEMTAKEILAKHETGQKYGNLISQYGKYPILVDANGKIMSMAPIINSNDIGKIDEHTKNLFVEITGTLSTRVDQFASILSYIFYSMGFDIESVSVHYENSTKKFPDIKPKTVKLSSDYIKSYTGLDLEFNEIKKLSRKMDMIAQGTDKSMDVNVPYYRVDVMHPVDVIEDILKAYGFNNMVPIKPKTYTQGYLLEKTKLARFTQSLFIGLGFNEVFTSSLSNSTTQYKNMEVKDYRPIMLNNSKSSDSDIVRESIIPEMLKLVSINEHVSLPIKIFEISDVVVRNSESDTGYSNSKRIAALIFNPVASFTDIKQVLDYIMRILDIEYQIAECSNASFIEGRAASVILNGKKIGILGEIHPQVLDNFKLTNPTVAMELNFDLIAERLTRNRK